jgi:hypothetical protein
MSDKFVPSLRTLPVELVYRILDHLTEDTILWSMRNICTRINAIVDSYHRYQVNFSFSLNSNFHHLLYFADKFNIIYMNILLI